MNFMDITIGMRVRSTTRVGRVVGVSRSFTDDAINARPMLIVEWDELDNDGYHIVSLANYKNLNEK